MKLNQVLKIAKREMKLIVGGKSTYGILILLPLVLFFILASVYQKGSLTDLPVAIYDADNSSLSRILTRSIESSPSFALTESINSFDELKTLMDTKKIYAAFYIPHDFEKDIKKGHTVNVVVYKNATNIVVSNLILKNATSVIKTVSAGVLIKKLQAKGNSYDKSYNTANALRLDTNALYNPFYNYENYIVPGLLVFTLQMIVMLISTIVFNSEFENNGISDLLTISNNKIIPIWFGKFLAHFIINAFTAIILMGIVFTLFGITIHGSNISVLLYLFFFNTVCISLGFMVSAMVKDKILASEIAIVINTPAFILSGFTFPISGMPSVHAVIADSMPFTYFLRGFIKLYQMNTPLSSLFPEIMVLVIFLLSSFLLTIFFLKRKTGVVTSQLAQRSVKNYA